MGAFSVFPDALPRNDNGALLERLVPNLLVVRPRLVGGLDLRELTITS